MPGKSKNEKDEIKPLKVKVVEYTGTVESYNDLVDYLSKGIDNSQHHIWFLDEENNMTRKFTGIVFCSFKRIKYKPGDHYSINIGKDEND